jgi:hypothetical protein
MCSTRWLGFAGALGLVLGSADLFTLRADEPAEAGRPVVAVSLCGAKLSDDLLKSLAAFHRLRALDLCHTEGLTPKRVALLANLTGLESLNVSRCPDVNAHGLFKLAALKNLRFLDVSHCTEVGDCELTAIRRNFPKLRSLNVTGCKDVHATIYHLLGLRLRAEVRDAGGCPGLRCAGNVIRAPC